MIRPSHRAYGVLVRDATLTMARLGRVPIQGRSNMEATEQRLHRCVTLMERIQDALGTAEEGDALVEVARNAHRAEQRLSGLLEALQRISDECGDYSLHYNVTKIFEIGDIADAAIAKART
jgi:hypothetical protein